MAIKTIMLLLTLAGDGSAHVNFSPAESMEACNAKIAAVRKVLKGAEIEIIDVRCAQSDIAVSKYKRGAKPDAPRHAYRVTLTQDGFSAVPVADGECKAGEAEDAKTYCATSTQRPLAAGE